jgi:hypothetical protein
MKYKWFFIILLQFLHYSIYSQTQSFEKTFGGINYESGYSIYQTSDGGYIIGADSIGIAGDKNIYLIKIDSAGNQE